MKNNVDLKVLKNNIESGLKDGSVDYDYVGEVNNDLVVIINGRFYKIDINEVYLQNFKMTTTQPLMRSAEPVVYPYTVSMSSVGDQENE